MYEKLLDLNNLHNAFLSCKKNVCWKASVQRYEANELYFINKLRNELLNGTYKQKPFYEFTINERGKVRHIKSLHIYDRVLQRCLCDNILLPIVRKYLIHDNGASLKGKGIGFTRKRLKVHLQKFFRENKKDGYVLLIDFTKFFDSINHEKLLNMFRLKIKDERVIKLLEYLVGTFGSGLGIGSQLSQVVGVFYTSRIDTFCKCVKGCKYYGRYMDDTYIIHKDKEFLKNLLKEIKQRCENLGITINEKKNSSCKVIKRV